MVENGSKARRFNEALRVTQIGRALPLLFLFMGLASGPAFAASPGTESAEPTLTETLHEKKILTDEEYEKLKAQDKKYTLLLKALDGLSVGTTSYLDFSGGEDNGESYNEFMITRGYITIQKTLTSWLRFRVTPDVTLDDTGDFKLRLKYLYAEFLPPNLSFLTTMAAEVGMGHMPWLDFEEHINPYRLQGTMFIERAGILNSADLGLSIRGYFGDPMPVEYQSNVSKYYAGRYGSWHFGVYNGGGYHADEENENKVPEVRVTLRPLPDLIPGLQVSYFGLFGKGNDESSGASPDYTVNLGMLSYQNSWIIFTGQYAITEGNNKGSYVVPDTDNALHGEGFSFFFNTHLPLLDRKLNFFARYDRFDPDTSDWLTYGDGNDSYDLVNSGLAWQFYKSCYLLLAYERIMYDKNNAGLRKLPAPDTNRPDDWRVQSVMQIAF